jgi:enolase-phosphatase E1
MPRGILLDIEGTTTPIKFVYDVLFPYARQRAAEYLQKNDVTDLKLEYDEDVRRGSNPPAWSRSGESYVYWLMDQDRKSTALKRIQGEIWLEGYERHELQGQVFPDVPPALKRWSENGIDIRIYSSGSVLAQRLILSSTRDGDLTGFLKGYFDTTTGPKNESDSYRKIAAAFGMAASNVLFISDVTRELDAAAIAGMQTLLCVRPGNRAQPPHKHPTIATFTEVENER